MMRLDHRGPAAHGLRSAPPGEAEPARSGSAVPRPRQEPTSVLVVDAYAPAREAIARELSAFGVGTVTEAASAADARVVAPLAGDLALVDVALPDGSGPGLVAELRAQGWARVVALSSSGDPALACAAMEAGAHAYLTSGAGSTAARPVPTTPAEASPSAPPTAGSALHATEATPRGLSAREIEVLQLVADGRSNKEIGDTLHLSSLTVKSHLSRIGRKLGTGDRAQLVALAMRAGVVR